MESDSKRTESIVAGKPAVPASAGSDSSIPIWDQSANTRSGDDVPALANTPVPKGDSSFPELLETFHKPGALGLGHYDVIELLGRGGFGTVVKAFDVKLQRTVAIKMMSNEMAATSPARRRFLREARASAAVRHENVVQIHAVEEKPVPYLVMEYIPGESLQQHLDRCGPLDPKDVVRLGAQIARGLAAAHDTKLVHRDIKPANILLERGTDFRAKLTDSGLARAADDASLTQSGTVAGTPMYMAPEQACGDAFDHRADLFSLGSVLYVMVSGRPPFRASTSMAVLKRVVEETPRSIREIIPETPQWLCEIIAKLHAKDPVDRYQTAHEVALLLADCEAQLQVHGELKDDSKIPGSATAATAVNTPKAKRPAPASSPRYYAAIGVALLILAIGIGQWLGILNFRGKSGGPLPATATSPGAPGGPSFTNSLGIKFALVPHGTSWLDGGSGSIGNKEINFDYDFYLGVYEITQGEWEAVMGQGNNPSKFSRNGSNSGDVSHFTDEQLSRFPVDSASWEQCMEFVAKLNEKIQERGWVYRLPKSAEWEYACRGGPVEDKKDLGFSFYLGKPTNTLSPAKANFKESGLNRPVPVGSYAPNKLGLYDMHGNVFEYCDELVTRDNESLAILRGGGWMDGPDFCEARNNGLGVSNGNYNGGGLRLALVPIGK